MTRGCPPFFPAIFRALDVISMRFQAIQKRIPPALDLTGLEPRFSWLQSVFETTFKRARTFRPNITTIYIITRRSSESRSPNSIAVVWTHWYSNYPFIYDVTRTLAGRSPSSIPRHRPPVPRYCRVLPCSDTYDTCACTCTCTCCTCVYEYMFRGVKSRR